MRFIRWAAHAVARHPRIFVGLVLVVALLFAFEVTVRHLPPDGMTVTKTQQMWMTGAPTDSGENPPPNSTVTTSATYSAATSPLWRAEMNRLNTDLDTAPEMPLTHFGGGCMGLGGYTDYQVTFTWHSFPVQTWTTVYGCSDFIENSGGIPNLLWARILPDTEYQTLSALT